MKQTGNTLLTGNSYMLDSNQRSDISNGYAMRKTHTPHSFRRFASNRLVLVFLSVMIAGLVLTGPGEAQYNFSYYLPFVRRAPTPEWSYTIIDGSVHEMSAGSSRYMMTDHAIRIGPDNLPRVVYYDNGLYYAAFNGQGWAVQVVDSAVNSGKYPSLALDGSGVPHISYYDDGSNHLRYAFWNGTGWTTQTVDSTSADTGQYSSIAIDSSGEPHIAYYDATNRKLKYIYRVGGFWEPAQDIETNTNPGYYYISLDLSQTNWGRIAFYDAAPMSENLKYAWWAGEEPTPRWRVYPPDMAGNMGVFASLALDANDLPRIAYMDDDNDNLKYAFHNGTSWNLSSIDTGGNVGFFATLAIDSNNRTHIAYYDATQNRQNLKYARNTGSGWEIVTLDTEAATDAGYFASLALDDFDLPYIAYYDNTYNIIKCAHRNKIP